MKELLLTVVTPSGKTGPIRCDSVRLTVSDDMDGRGGGSCGIRPGHASALLSLSAGPLTALQGGRVILNAQCGGGFASVDGDEVTVATDDYKE